MPKITTMSKVSKRTAGLLTIALTVVLGWTLSSGFKEPPEAVVTSSSVVELAWLYRGVCEDVSVFRGDEELDLIREEVRDGLATISFQVPPGQHDLTVKFVGVVPGLETEYPLEVTVDRQAPPLEAGLEGAAPQQRRVVTTEESLTLTGRTEAGSLLRLEGEEVSVQDDGAFQATLELSAGWNHVLLASTDPAGNRTKRTYSIFRDTQVPELSWHTTPDEVFDKKTARVEINLSDDGAILGVSGKVDGEQPVTWYAKGEGRWVGITEELHEGFHEISIKAADESGRVVSGRRQVVIDSSEALGEAVLGLGARGEDVRLLHERLAEAGFLSTDAIKEVFDKTTQEALKKLQEAEGFEVTGMAEGETLIALGPRIFINLGNYSLVLDRPGQELKRWMIARGSADHPTPVGDFVIAEKVMHPTWLPPKSEWAKDAEPIPPGPGNPLGTRWLGFDWGGVGIHGTNAPWSVGTAASHGCMRMVTSQVEELFELVEVGTPVVVFGGWEDDPVLERYWP